MEKVRGRAEPDRRPREEVKQENDLGIAEVRRGRAAGRDLIGGDRGYTEGGMDSHERGGNTDSF